MRISNINQWGKYLEKASKGYLDKKIKRGREREKRNKEWSWGKRQSLADLYAKELSSRPTAAEIIFGNYLLELGITPFFFQKVLLKPKIFIIDFYVRDKAFEIDGSYHIGNEAKDLARDELLKHGRGIMTYRFTNSEVLKNPEQTKIKIMEILKENPIIETDNKLSTVT